MARSEVRTKLSLDEWAKFMGINPLHFNQLVIGDLAGAICGQGWFQHDYQDHDRVSRDDVARAIAIAEANIESLLGYRLLPSWEVDEWQATIQPLRPEMVNLNGSDLRGFAAGVRAEWGYFISGGVEARSLISAGAAVVYTDVDMDSYKETATVTVAVADDVAECEVALFYPDKDGDEAWEIRPIDVSIAAGVATIVFRRELAVVEEELERMPITEESRPRGLDATNDLYFLDTVDVYRHYNDPQTQASLLWEPTGICACIEPGSCAVCAYGVQSGCLLGRGDGRVPLVSYRPASWDASLGAHVSAGWSMLRAPDAVRLWYYAGWRDKRALCPNIRMDQDWARTVSIYAAALLDRPVCECSAVQAGVARWQNDLAFSGGADELATYNMNERDLANPLGTKAGALYAWKRIQRPGAGAAILRGV